MQFKAGDTVTVKIPGHIAHAALVFRIEGEGMVLKRQTPEGPRYGQYYRVDGQWKDGGVTVTVTPKGTETK